MLCRHGVYRKRGTNMTGSAYQNWLKKEEEWIGAYCSRIRKNSILTVVPLTILLLAVLFGGMALLGGGSTQDLLTGMVGGLFLGLIICAFYLAVLLLQLRPGRYVQKIEQSVKALSANDMEKEFLGREMLAALEGGEQVLSYQMIGPNSNGTPARVILTPHYILQEGSSPYAVLVRLSDIAEVKTGSEQKMAVTHGAKSKTCHHFTLYTIGFYRKDRFDRGLSENDPPDYAMGFFQENLRDSAAGMIKNNGMRVQHPEV